MMRETIKNTFLGASLLLAGLALLLASRAQKPKKAKPVRNFDLRRYMGTWYEIARFDYRFEKNMDNVMAQYHLNQAGNVQVRNSGYNQQKRAWRSAKGIAKFRGNPQLGALKVSFFGPFYAGYNVIAIDSAYQYALVAGRSLDYLWILSRKKTIPETIKNRYLKMANAIGYDTTKLIWVKHDKKSPFEKAASSG